MVNGVKAQRSTSAFSLGQEGEAAPFLPVLSEGSIRLVLLTSGEMLVARLRQTTDSDGDRAHQLIRPLRLVKRQKRSLGHCFLIWPVSRPSGMW